MSLTGMVLRRITGRIGAAPVGRVMLFYSAALRKLRLVDDAGTVSDISGGGGGVSAHPDLTGLAWTASDHTMSAARRLAGSGATSAAAEVTYTAYTETLLDDANAAAARTTLGVVIGTDVCAQGDARLSDSRAPNGSAGGDLGGTYPNPTVSQARGLRESGGTTLTMATVADGELLRRVGTTVDGLAVSETPAAGTVPKAQADGTLNANWFPSGVKAIELFSRFSTVIPSTGTALANDGAGTLTTGGIYAVNVSATDYPCIQIGDAGTATSRAYVTAAWRTAEGTIYVDLAFRLGSDVSGSTQHYFIGMTSQLTLASTDPAGHRVMIRHISGGANWQFTTKDNATENLQSTGVAVTASNFYRVRFSIAATTSSVWIGTGATAQDAADSFDAATATTSTTNLPTTTQDLILAASLQRLAGATTRCIQLNGMWTKSVPAWAA